MRAVLKIILIIVVTAILGRLGWAYFQVKSDDARISITPALVATTTPELVQLDIATPVTSSSTNPSTKLTFNPSVSMSPKGVMPSSPSVSSSTKVSTPSWPSGPPGTPSPKVVVPTAPAISAQTKNLAFALLSLSNPQNVSQVSALLANNSIDGVAVQIGWTSMETSDGVFNWATLDTALKTAKDSGKRVTLHIFSGGPFGIASWLKNAGVETYSVSFMGRTREEALPWDQTFLSQYSQFLTSLAGHLSSAGYLSTVARISVGVPVAEMDLVACRDKTLASVYPYNRDTYLSSWKTMIDAHASAFPTIKKFVSAPVGLICYPDRDTQFFTDVMDYAFQKYDATFVPFAADLTTEGSDRMKPYTSMVASRGLGYQPIWSSTNDTSNRTKGTYPGNLLQATCKAVADGADYVEIYAVDVMNSDATIQKGIQAVHDTSLCK